MNGENTKWVAEKAVIGSIEAIRHGLAAVFVFSAVSHLQNTNLFLLDILNYQILNGRAAILVAGTLPFLELVIALLLCSRISSQLPAVAAWLLLILFFGVQWSAWSRGLIIDCGCFGGIVRSEIGFQSLFLTGILMAAASLLILIQLACEPKRVYQAKVS